ncbi:hypothetical protein KPH14_000880, partial [Odynerus spinipes]
MDAAIKKEQRDPKLKEAVRCYNCHGMGHFSAECERPRRRRGSCFKCGSLDHKVEQCKQTTSRDVSYVAPSQAEEDEFHPTVTVSLGGNNGNTVIRLVASIDSGSPISFVKKSLIPSKFVEEAPDSSRFLGINNSIVQIYGNAKVTIVIEQATYDVVLRVVDDGTMRSSLVLGRDFMKLAKLTLNISEGIKEIMNIEAATENEEPFSQMVINNDLPLEVQERTRNLFVKSYLEPVRPEVPRVENVTKLKMIDEKPFRYAPRRLSYSEKEKIK